MQYRAEIDGVRAVAVVPVILFHAGFEWFSGGFVGVDVFFVISGYLITTILIEDIERGRLNLVNFYERRARRILPALFLVMLVCIPFAWLWMLPAQLEDFSQSLVAVSVFVSNVLFWSESGYFAAAAEQKPFLHTWSLAIEEQYYLIFPVFLLIAWRFAKDKVLLIIFVLAMVSLGLSEWGSRNAPIANFYLAPMRVWEILAGSVAALIVQRHGLQRNDLMSMAGLLAIIFAVLFFDETTPFPGIYALVPVLGTVLLVIFADKDSIAAKLLSSRILVAVGLISYSAYLWHQPLFAFTRIRFPEYTTDGFMLALSLLSLALAYVSWKYIEAPFRNRETVSRKGVAIFSIAGIALFLVAGSAGHFANGFPSRLDVQGHNGLAVKKDQQSEVLAWKNYPREAYYLEGACFMRSEQTAEDFEARCSKLGSALIWGDSHAAALASGWRMVDSDVGQLTASACPPILDENFGARPHCRLINEFASESAIKTPERTVYLHANWNNYPSAIVENLGRTLDSLKQAGVRDIVVIGGVPHYAPSLPDVLVRNGVSLGREHKIANDLSKVRARDTLLEEIAVRNGVRFVSMLDIFCDDDQCQTIISTKKGFALTAWDHAHLTKEGAEFASRKVLKRKGGE